MSNTAMNVVIPATSFNSQEWTIEQAQLDPNESHTYQEIQDAVLAASQDGLAAAAADAGVSVATLQKWIDNPVDVYNMAIAFGMTYNSDYAQRLNAQLEQAKANTEDLAEVNKLLNTALTPEAWDADPAGSTTKTRAMGIEVPGNTISLTAADFNPGANPALFHNYKWPPIPYPPIGSSGNLQTDVVYRLPNGTLTVSYNIPGVGAGGGLIRTEPTPFLAHPTPEDLAAVRSSAEDLADTLTQTSQVKQAFIQELMAKIDQFLKFASNILEKASRVKEGILSKIS
ncbi:MAG: hypothetical protein V4787_19580 [Pseudomonadota bacterium]